MSTAELTYPCYVFLRTTLADGRIAPSGHVVALPQSVIPDLVDQRRVELREGAEPTASLEPAPEAAPV